MKLKVKEVETESDSVRSDSLLPHGLYSPLNSPGQNTGVGSLSLLQGIFPTQGSNPGLPHCKWILYQLSYQGISDEVLEAQKCLHFLEMTALLQRVFKAVITLCCISF